MDPGKAEQLIADGMRQTTKQYNNLIETRVGVLQSQGIEAAVDPRLTKAVDILKQVEAKGLAPAKAEALLKAELQYVQRRCGQHARSATGQTAHGESVINDKEEILSDVGQFS